MISSLLNIFKVHDLRNKILFVIAMVVVYRFGVAIRVPGVDPIAIEQLRESASQQGALGFLNLFSGGAFESFSIFALGIMPYITASIIMQVLGVVIPKLEELQSEGLSASARSPSTRAISRSVWPPCRPPAWCSSSAPVVARRSSRPRAPRRRCRCSPTASGRVAT